MSPSASETLSVHANALTYGKEVFQCPQRAEPTSHMCDRAKTAFRPASRSHSRKSFVNSRRGDGVTPQFHSTNATSSRRRGTPLSFVSRSRQSSAVASGSTKSVHSEPTPWSAARNVVAPIPCRHSKRS